MTTPRAQLSRGERLLDCDYCKRSARLAVDAGNRTFYACFDHEVEARQDADKADS